MRTEGMVECRVELYPIVPKALLRFSPRDVEPKTGRHNASSNPSFGPASVIIPEEFQAAGGYTSGLFPKRFCRLATIGNTHPLKPISHGPA